MPTTKLTHRGIATLEVTGKWLTDYMDESLPGFGVRAHHTGRKVFFVRYTGDDGKRRRIKIGPYPTLNLADARDKVKEIIGRIARGEDPQAEKVADRQATTFGQLAEEYLELHAKRKKRSWREDERVIRRFWRALDDFEPTLAATFKMRLLTAQRGVEVLTMRWEQIRGDWWTIPGEVAKNGLAHRVPISPQVRELLDELHGLTGKSVWVFASPRKKGSHLKTVTRATQRIAEAAGIEDFTAHDLRRTAASHMTSMGIPRLVVSKILNHAESGITAVYDRHSYDAEKRQALARWAGRLEMILGGGRESAKVVRIA